MEGRPILVVDDDRSIRESIELVLALEGYRVYARTPKTGSSGLRADTLG
jgi:DNA-binding response OmpR family regulator